MVSIIILAAGSSSRMGQSKQLLPWKVGTLLSHAVKTAIDSRAGHVFVVLGNNESKHQEAIKDNPVTIISNPSWEKGMGSSLKAGLSKARDVSEAVLVMVCDQPFVTTNHLNNIIEHFERTNQQVVASRYLETTGVPALFARSMFDELMQIGDDEGARKVITKHKREVAAVYLKSGADLDTPDDYRNALH